jgi:hypothetical protein
VIGLNPPREEEGMERSSARSLIIAKSNVIIVKNGGTLMMNAGTVLEKAKRKGILMMMRLVLFRKVRVMKNL